jgi:D-aspartate ligase
MSPADLRSRAVVVGLDCITGLQSTRLLADRGVPVIGIAANHRHFCVRTRAARRKITAPISGEGLIRALENLSKRFPADQPAFLLPCTDAAVLTISRERERLEGSYRFVLPDHAVIERLMDKVAFAEYAQAKGLPVPPTVILRDRHDAARAAESLDFPVLLKPSLKTHEWLARSRTKVYQVQGPADLLATYDRIRDWAPTLIAQAWVEGDESALYSCNAYFDRAGEPLVTFVARKIRQWPPETGTSSLGVEVQDAVVLQTTLDLFTGASYSGLAYLELKRDARTGRYWIIEPNLGRPTGRSAIAERGGVDLLFTAYCDALGLPLPPNRKQNYSGVKWIYWRHDLQAAAVAMRRRKLTPAGWLRSVRGPSIEAVASLRDPLPMIAELAHVAGQVWLAAKRRLSSATAQRP